MNGRSKIVGIPVILGIIVLFSDVGMSWIIVGGGEPIEDRGWPSGCVEMANLAARFGWWEGPPFGGGEYHFLYRCQNTGEFNQALEKFAAIDGKRLELVVHNGPKKDFVVEGPVHWTFLAWLAKNWDSLNNSSRNFYRPADSGSTKPVPMARKTMPAPRIDVYLGGDNPIIWKDVKVPANLVVIDRRPASVAPQFPDKGLLRGKVFDLESKKPIAGAMVLLLERVQRTDAGMGRSAGPASGGPEWKTVKDVTTNARGLCQIDQIRLGAYEVSVSAEGYVSVDLERYDNTPAECYEFEVGLLRPFSISGVVTDAKGAPLQGIGVQAGDFVGPDGNGYPHQADSPVLTDAQGRFEIPDLPKGFVSIRCRAEGLHQADSIFEKYPVPSKQIRLTMTGTGVVRGKVITEQGKRPSGQIVLELNPPGEERLGKWGWSGYLSADGTFDISGIPPGEYIISTRPNPCGSDYQPNAKRITVEAGKVYDLEIVHAEEKQRC